MRFGHQFQDLEWRLVMLWTPIIHWCLPNRWACTTLFSHWFWTIRPEVGAFPEPCRGWMKHCCNTNRPWESPSTSVGMFCQRLLFLNQISQSNHPHSSSQSQYQYPNQGDQLGIGFPAWSIGCKSLVRESYFRASTVTRGFGIETGFGIGGIHFIASLMHIYVSWFQRAIKRTYHSGVTKLYVHRICLMSKPGKLNRTDPPNSVYWNIPW